MEREVTTCFTHVDPFEDTESRPCPPPQVGPPARFTHVDPFEDTESRPCPPPQVGPPARFTHVDPFEDTERTSPRGPWTSPV